MTHVKRLKGWTIAPKMPKMPKTPDKPNYPWTATKVSIPELVLNGEDRKDWVFPGTGIPPILAYSISNPNSLTEVIALDETQLGAVNLILSGQSCNIIGAAGTGKSTILQAALELLHPHLGKDVSYRIVRSSGQRSDGPSAALIAYTNKAKNVIRSKIQASQILLNAGFDYNITTAHNLLEYTRVEGWNEKEQRVTMRFEEQRNTNFPLDISHLFIDESSQIGVGKKEAQQLGNKLLDAMHAGTQLVLIGDINQLPPVGGKSILSYGLVDLPIAELTTIHRQALDSPIIAQAWNVLQGKLPLEQTNLTTGSNFRIIDPKPRTVGAKVGAVTMNKRLEVNFPKFIEKGYFVPGRDMVLCPFNKPQSGGGRGNEPKTYVSTTHINAVIAGYLSKKEEREVYHIIAGFNNIFLAVGDRVLVDKVEGVVTDIKKNHTYWGKKPMVEGKGLNYWGHREGKVGRNMAEEIKKKGEEEFDFTALDIDSIDESEENKELGKSASHIVNVVLDGGDEVILASAGQFQGNIFSLGYAISVHKAQGSEWENVFVIIHDCHAMMLSRELLYTAITRPRKNLFLIGQKHTIKKAVHNARIKGTSLEEKIGFFNDGEYLNAGEDFSFGKLS